MKLRKMADVVVLIGIGVCIGGMASDVSSAERSLSDWQTLIAGFFAVAAAAWTVGEMRKQDQSQQARHEELMKLNLRSDRLRVMRAANPYAAELRARGNDLALAVESLDLALANFSPEAYESLRDNVDRPVRQIAAIIAGIEISDASKLFEADMAYNLKCVRDQMSPLVGALNSANNVLARTQVGSNSPELRDWVGKLREQAALMFPRINKVASDLENLSDIYS